MSNRKVDAGWMHGKQVIVEGNKKKVKCNYCPKVVGGITRLKQHLAHVGTDVTGCPNVTSEVYQEMRNLLGVQQNVGRNEEIEEDDHQALSLPKIKIAFKGIIGACSEDAAHSVHPHCKIDPCQTFEEAFKAVESLGADKAIIPIENSLGGSFHENYDLISSHPLHIVGECKASMNFCLLARCDTRLDQLERVLGDSQALEQTKTFLRNLGVVEDIVHDDPYFARLILSSNSGYTQLSTSEVGMAQQPTGVIGSGRAVEWCNLHVVATGIQDQNAKESITRFWILARDPVVPTNDKSFKTSLVFALKDGPKELDNALSVFAKRDIKVTKIVSRPQRNIPPNRADSSTEETAHERFGYLFYVDFKASMAESRAESAVKDLKELTTYMRILGSYPLIEASRSA